MKKRFISLLLIMLLVFTFNMTVFADYSEDYFYYTVENESVTITGCFGKQTELTVPSMIAGCPVNHIASGAFKGNGYLKVVNLPDTIMTIAEDAFDPGITVNMAGGEETTTAPPDPGEPETQVTEETTVNPGDEPATEDETTANPGDEPDVPEETTGKSEDETVKQDETGEQQETTAESGETKTTQSYIVLQDGSYSEVEIEISDDSLNLLDEEESATDKDGKKENTKETATDDNGKPVTTSAESTSSEDSTGVDVATGGTSPVPFIICGAIIVVAAAVVIVIVVKKKKDKEEKENKNI